MDGVTVINHPLVQHKLTIMRKKETSTAGFRRLLREISTLLCYEIAGDLVAEQGGNLTQQPTETSRRGLLLAHDGQLVLHQRMIDDCNAVHGQALLRKPEFKLFFSRKGAGPQGLSSALPRHQQPTSPQNAASSFWRV